MIKDSELISIVVPVYNVENYIDRCISSLINQDYKNIEILLIDDGSNDSSGMICDSYAKKDERIKVVHGKNEGVSAARNKGIKLAKGDWISFVDSDDWIKNNYISLMHSKAIENRVDYVTCGYYRFSCDKVVATINGNGKYEKISSSKYIKKLLNVQNGYGFCHMKLIKSSIIKSIEFDTTVLVGEDALFNVNLCKKIDEVLILNEPLYYYRLNLNSVVRKYDEDYMLKYKVSMEKMLNYIKENYSNDKGVIQTLNNYIAYHSLLVAVNFCCHPLNENKRECLKKLRSDKIFSLGIEQSNFDDLSFNRRVSLLMMKNKNYLFLETICRFRQKQFRRG